MGDSSSAGASVNSLHFGTLSSANVGDANGKMVYSQGQGVFMDVTKGGAVTDTANDADRCRPDHHLQGMGRAVSLGHDQDLHHDRDRHHEYG